MNLLECLLKMLQNGKLKEIENLKSFEEIYKICKQEGYKDNYENFEKECINTILNISQEVSDEHLEAVSGGKISRNFSKSTAAVLSALTLSTTIMPSSSAASTYNTQTNSKFNSFVNLVKNNPGKTLAAVAAAVTATTAGVSTAVLIGRKLYKDSHNKAQNEDLDMNSSTNNENINTNSNKNSSKIKNTNINSETNSGKIKSTNINSETNLGKIKSTNINSETNSGKIKNISTNLGTNLGTNSSVTTITSTNLDKNSSIDPKINSNTLGIFDGANTLREIRDKFHGYKTIGNNTTEWINNLKSLISRFKYISNQSNEIDTILPEIQVLLAEYIIYMISVTEHNGLGVINNETLQNIVKVFNDEANEVGKDTKLGQTFDIYGNFVSKMSIKGITYPGRAELLYFLTSVLKGKDSFEKCVKQAIFDDSCYVASLVRDEIGKNQYHKLDVVTATEETLTEEDYSKIMTSFRINTGITCVENVGSSEEKSYKIEGCLYHKIGENKILIATNSEKVTDNSILKFDNTWKRFVIPDSLGNMTHFYVKGSLIITYGDSVSSASIRTAKSVKEFCEKSQCRKLKDNEQKEIDDLLSRICSII